MSGRPKCLGKRKAKLLYCGKIVNDDPPDPPGTTTMWFFGNEYQCEGQHRPEDHDKCMALEKRRLRPSQSGTGGERR